MVFSNNLILRFVFLGSGAWLVAQQAGQRRHYKAVTAPAKSFEEVHKLCTNKGHIIRESKNRAFPRSISPDEDGLLDGFLLASIVFPCSILCKLLN